MSKYYDDFSKLPLDKMAKSITDMTYAYEQTRVPKSHYQEILEKEVIELLSSNETNFTIALIKPYLDMITQMMKENSKLFYLALFINELKIPFSKIDGIIYDGLELTYKSYEENKKMKNILNEELVTVFNEFKKHGINDAKENNDMEISSTIEVIQLIKELVAIKDTIEILEWLIYNMKVKNESYFYICGSRDGLEQELIEMIQTGILTKEEIVKFLNS